jgi:hypothetical protein
MTMARTFGFGIGLTVILRPKNGAGDGASDVIRVIPGNLRTQFYPVGSGKQASAALQPVLAINPFASSPYETLLLIQNPNDRPIVFLDVFISCHLLTGWPLQFRNCKHLPPQVRISNLHRESTRVTPGKVIGNLDVEFEFVSKCPKNQRFPRTHKT